MVPAAVPDGPDTPSGPVRSTLAGGLLTLSLHRPERHNALDDALKRDLAREFARAAGDPGVRAVLLRGDGPSFCAGGDVRRIDGGTAVGPEPGGATRAQAMLGQVRELVLALIELDKPVVAAVQGHVIGAGVGLALAADIVIAADDVRFAFPFASYALPPDMLTGYLLPRAIGPARARALLLRPRVIEAEEALASGLVSELVPANDLGRVAAAAAGDLAAGPTLAYARIKRQCELAASTDAGAFAEIEAEDHGRCVDSADHAEVVRARREGRAPTFVGA